MDSLEEPHNDWILDISTEKVDRSEGTVKWSVDAVTCQDLAAVLDRVNNKTEKVVFVDCQSSSGNTGKQFRGADRLNIAAAPFAKEVFQQLYKKDAKTFAQSKLFNADLVVFYCSFGNARSPAAMTSYLNLKASLAARGNMQNRQKVVLLAGGVDGFEKLKDGGKRLESWGHVSTKVRMVELKNDAIVGDVSFVEHDD